MSDRLIRRSRREDNRASSSPDPSDFQEPSSSTSDLATDPRYDYSQNAARSQDHLRNELYIDTTDNQTDDRSEFVSSDSRFVSDENSPLLQSPTSQIRTFTDGDVLARSLGSPPRTVVSPESVGRRASNRLRTPRRQLTFRLPNTVSRSPQSDQALDSEASLQTNLERLTITGRTRRLSEQGLHSGEPPSPAEHQRRRRRHFSVSAMSAAQQQQFRHLDQFHGGDSLLTVATRVDHDDTQRPERRRHFTGSPMSANRRPHDQLPDSENGLLMNLERTTIGNSRRLSESLHSEQQEFPPEAPRRRRRHLTGSPRSVAQQQHFMHLTEQFLSGNDLIIASSQCPPNNESERPERRRHLSGSHLPGSLQIVSLDQLLSSENDSLTDSAHPSEPSLRQEYRCERHRNRAEGESRMDQSAINSSRNYKRSHDENMPPPHKCPGESRWESSRDPEENSDPHSISQRPYSPSRTRQSLPQHDREQLSPKRHKSKHQEQSAVIPKKHCSAQFREEPLQDIQNIDRDQSEHCRDCQRCTAERERSIQLYERFRLLLSDSLRQYSNEPCQPCVDQPDEFSMNSEGACQPTVSEIDTNFGADRQPLRAGRLSTSEEFCHPHHMDEYYEQDRREEESSHQLSVFGDENLYYSAGQEDHQYNIVEAQHHHLHSLEEEHQHLVEEEPHPQLGIEESQHHAVAEEDLQHLLEEVQHHQSSEEDEKYQQSKE